MGKDQELLDAARNGNASVVEKILSQRAKRSGPLARLTCIVLNTLRVKGISTDPVLCLTAPQKAVK
ncbi:hypothetical protein RUM43_006215 [Polyplax serrata]|uniref:Uncharacterized protein n=1 Tax=Polyplax serrata TaxID=468196 RepID=A0AAN8RV85_POLSC